MKLVGCKQLAVHRDDQRRDDGQEFLLIRSLGAKRGKPFLAPGRVLIAAGNATVAGAIGITVDTSDNDELCALAGLEAVRVAIGASYVGSPHHRYLSRITN